MLPELHGFSLITLLLLCLAAAHTARVDGACHGRVKLELQRFSPPGSRALSAASLLASQPQCCSGVPAAVMPPRRCAPAGGSRRNVTSGDATLLSLPDPLLIDILLHVDAYER